MTGKAIKLPVKLDDRSDRTIICTTIRTIHIDWQLAIGSTPPTGWFAF